MVDEVLKSFELQPNQWYIDATFGRGGHTQKLINAGAKVIAFDHDLEAIEYGQEKFKEEIANGQLILIRENFNKLKESLNTLTLKPEISGILFDFGTSVDQLKDEERGFSFETDAPLDMRMDDRLGVKAKDLLALLNEKQLEDLFRNEGGEDQAKSIARAIVKVRATKPIQTTKELADTVSRVKQNRGSHLHPATKVFQALRIAVNTELQNIDEALPQAFEILSNSGRLVTISFHEGEDRIAKTLMKRWEEQHKGYQLTKKPLQPTEAEVQINNRARSAKLRAFIKQV